MLSLASRQLAASPAATAASVEKGSNNRSVVCRRRDRRCRGGVAPTTRVLCAGGVAQITRVLYAGGMAQITQVLCAGGVAGGVAQITRVACRRHGSNSMCCVQEAWQEAWLK